MAKHTASVSLTGVWRGRRPPLQGTVLLLGNEQVPRGEPGPCLARMQTLWAGSLAHDGPQAMPGWLPGEQQAGRGPSWPQLWGRLLPAASASSISSPRPGPERRSQPTAE